jgi:hypothetical protein
MRTVLALLTAMLAMFAIVTPEVAAQACTPTNPCRASGDPTATCVPNTTTGYTCTCDSGFIFNGVTCTQDLCAAVTCTASDQCHVAGTCNPATGICSNPIRADGTACNDGNACTQTDTCQNGACVGSNPVVCPATNQCHVAGTCNPATGQCSNAQVVADGTACHDDPCTTGSVCTAGACGGGTFTPDECLDHFKCYTANHVSPSTVAQNVTLADEFESTNSQVSTIVSICTPVDKNNEGIVDPRLHLVCYQIRDAASFSGATLQTTNQFGQETIHVNKPQMLCVPSTKK